MAENELLQKIMERLDAQPKPLSEDQVRAMVQTHLDGLVKDPEFVRKMRFAGEPKLVGSKFSRWGLSIADIEWLYDLENSMRGMPKAGGGVHSGPSPELEAAFKDISDARLHDARAGARDRQDRD